MKTRLIILSVLALFALGATQATRFYDMHVANDLTVGGDVLFTKDTAWNVGSSTSSSSDLRLHNGFQIRDVADSLWVTITAQTNSATHTGASLKVTPAGGTDELLATVGASDATELLSDYLWATYKVPFNATGTFDGQADPFVWTINQDFGAGLHQMQNITMKETRGGSATGISTLSNLDAFWVDPVRFPSNNVAMLGDLTVTSNVTAGAFLGDGAGITNGTWASAEFVAQAFSHANAAVVTGYTDTAAQNMTVDGDAGTIIATEAGTYKISFGALIGGDNDGDYVTLFTNSVTTARSARGWATSARGLSRETVITLPANTTNNLVYTSGDADNFVDAWLIMEKWQ